MASVLVSRGEMLKRVARFDELKPIDYASFIKGYVPDGMQGYALIGRAGKTVPPVDGEHGFTMVINKVSPGKGAPLHSHPKPEVFVVLAGKCAFYWGDKGENEVVLGPWDTISFPAGVQEGFRNIGDEDAHLLVVLTGSEVGEVTFASQGDKPEEVSAQA